MRQLNGLDFPSKCDIFTTICYKYITKEAAMRNRLAWLGLLGVLGVFGIITEERGMLGFFGFFVYFSYAAVIPDELFILHVRQSASAGFFVGMPAMALTIAAGIFTKSETVLILGLAGAFALSVLVFTLLLLRYESQEKRGAAP